MSKCFRKVELARRPGEARRDGMAETLPIPPFPAAEVRPSRVDLEQGTAALRAELEATTDRSLQALLAHHLAREAERQGDLAAAARDQLAATHFAAGFTEPLEALWSIAMRGRSRANVEKLLDRLGKIARTAPERQRAALEQAARHLAAGELGAGRQAIEVALDAAPHGAAAWILLERLAWMEQDLGQALRAATGRAGATGHDAITALLHDRSARIQAEYGDLDGASASLDQSLLIFPRLETFLDKEQLFWRAGRTDAAAAAALELLDHIELAQQGQPRGDPLPPRTSTDGGKAAIRLRAALWLAEAGQLARASEQVERASQAPDASLLEAALLLALGERTSEQSDGERDLEKLALSRALAALEPDDSEGRRTLGVFGELYRHRQAPWHAELPPEARTPGLLGLELVSHEQARNLSALPGFFARVAELDSRERAELYFAALLLAFASRDPEQVHTLLERATASGLDADRALGLELAAQRVADSRQGELAVLERGLTGETDPFRRVRYAWLGLRLALIEAAQGGERGADGAETVGRLQKLLDVQRSPSKLATLSRGLVARAKSRAGEGESIDARASGAGTAAASFWTSDELLRAERLLADPTAGGTPSAQRLDLRYDELEAAARRAPHDGLLAATAAEAARVAGAPASDQAALWRRFAASSQDYELAQAARLRALLLLVETHLEAGAEAHLLSPPPEAVSTLLAELQSEPEFTALVPWLSRLRGITWPDDSERTRARFERTEPFLQLEAAFRELPQNPGAALEVLTEPVSKPARLLALLVASTLSPHLVEEIAPDVPGLEDRTTGALALATAARSTEPGAVFEAASRFHQLAPGIDSLLALAAAARSAGKIEDEARARRALSDRLGVPELALHCQLESSATRRDAERIEHLIALAASAPASAQPIMAWDLCEAVGAETGPALRTRALDLLADTSPGSVDEGAASLLAAYQEILAGNDAAAITRLTKLESTLPDEPTIHIGLRFAALRSGRPDVEAAACAELARREEDHAASAELWERAGVLYQDQLDAPERAEAAFMAAMGRVPGSPLSFVRLYQLAHAEGDRRRMIELLDARLESPSTPEQRASLLWEKARHSRQLGRRSSATRALEELLSQEPEHLPALALLAELHLVDKRQDRAAPILAAVALHAQTPLEQRASAGLYAVDLLEKQSKFREAVALVVDLERLGIPSALTRRRRARLAARAGEWDLAAISFRQLAEEEDDIQARLEAARMLLAIERDHLRQTDDLKTAARLVLRDAPTDADAVSIALTENFHEEERARLLAPAREATLAHLRGEPLDLGSIQRMVDLAEKSADPVLERVWLGTLALMARPSPERAARLAHWGNTAGGASSQAAPRGILGQVELEYLSAPGQLGALERLARLVVPAIAKASLPNLEGLGLTDSMRLDLSDGSALGVEISAWAEALAVADLEVYVGGARADGVLLLPGPRSALVLEAGLSSPLGPETRARLASLLCAEHWGVGPLVLLGFEETALWLAAVGRLAARSLPSAAPDEVEKRALELARLFSSEERQELNDVAAELERSGRDVLDLCNTSLASAARTATLVHGDPSILRRLREFVPSGEAERAKLLAQVVRFVASPHFHTLRQKLGFDLP